MNKDKWRKGIKIAVVIVFLDIFFLYLGTLEKLHITLSVGSVGIITFFGILMLVNYLSDSLAVDKGEMRKAIAGSFIAVYFIVLSWITFREFSPSDTELAGTIIRHFTHLIGVIVGFYFTSSTIREYRKIKKAKSMAYYTKNDPSIYHVCENCTVGNKIEKENLREGIPPGAKLCDECASLQREGKCIYGTPLPAR